MRTIPILSSDGGCKKIPAYHVQELKDFNYIKTSPASDYDG